MKKREWFIYKTDENIKFKIMTDLKYTLLFALQVIDEYGLETVEDGAENNLKEMIQEQIEKL